MVVIKDNDIVMTHGDTLRQEITIYDEVGVPYVFSDGDELIFGAKDNFGSNEYYIYKQIPTDTCVLLIEPEDTNGIPMEIRLLYDIELRRVNGDVSTITHGSIKVIGEVVTADGSGIIPPQDSPSTFYPDYAKNEEGKGYIKNRPCYIDDNGVAHKLDTRLYDKTTKTSELINDSGFVTEENVPTRTSELINDSGFVTEVPVTDVLVNGVSAVEDGIAEITIQKADWNESSSYAPSYIRNKPRLPQFYEDVDAVIEQNDAVVYDVGESGSLVFNKVGGGLDVDTHGTVTFFMQIYGAEHWRVNVTRDAIINNVFYYNSNDGVTPKDTSIPFFFGCNLRDRLKVTMYIADEDAFFSPLGSLVGQQATFNLCTTTSRERYVTRDTSFQTIKIGNTTLNEQQLVALLGLLS